MTKPNNSMETNRRCLYPLAAKQNLGSSVHAQTILPAAVAHLKRYA
jgi:hypothetical protein